MWGIYTVSIMRLIQFQSIHTRDVDETSLSGIPAVTSLDSYGIRIRIPIIETSSWVIAVTFSVDRRNGRHLGLLLTPDSPLFDPSRPRYHIGGYYLGNSVEGGSTPGTPFHYIRTIPLGTNLTDIRFNDRVVTAKWTDIYIARNRPNVESEASIEFTRFNRTIETPFRFSEAMTRRFLRKSSAFHVNVMADPIINIRQQSGKQPLVPWTGASPRKLAFHISDSSTVLFLDLFLGRCTRSNGNPLEPSRACASERPSLALGPHWATVESGTRGILHDEHQCSVDHICDWPGRSKTFAFPYDRDGSLCIEVTIYFTPNLINPEGTLVVSDIFVSQVSMTR